MDRSLLPSKQFIITLIVVTVFLVGGVAVYLNTKEESGSNGLFSKTDRAEMEKIAQTVTQSDQDGDGLFDWEESLWKTDPENPDTDGDGTPDGDEVNIGRDPITPGPDDAIDRERISVLTDEAVAKAGPNNLTATFARNFFIEYAKTKQAKLPVAAMTASEGRIQNMLPEDPFAKKSMLFNDGDIEISPSDDVFALRAYGNAFGSIISAHRLPDEDLMQIFYRSVKSGDKTDLAKLSNASEAIEGMSKDLLLLPVPKSLAQNHISQLNTLSDVDEIYRGMHNVFSDPLTGMVALVHYYEVYKRFAVTTVNTAKFLELNGVIYQESDPGYIFTQALNAYKKNPKQFI